MTQYIETSEHEARHFWSVLTITAREAARVKCVVTRLAVGNAEPIKFFAVTNLFIYGKCQWVNLIKTFFK